MYIHLKNKKIELNMVLKNDCYYYYIDIISSKTVIIRKLSIGNNKIYKKNSLYDVVQEFQNFKHTLNRVLQGQCSHSCEYQTNKEWNSQ